MFVEVLVEEVIADPGYYTQDLLRSIVPKIVQSHRNLFCDVPIEQPDEKDPAKNVYYLRAPRNTILGRPVSETTTSIIGRDGFLNVYYPFFSSHFSLPVKPGETVWAYKHGESYYWLSRVSQPLNVEDPNFTHADRKETPVRKAPIIASKGEAGSFEQITDDTDNAIERVPNFQNGSDFRARNSDRVREVAQEDIDDEKKYPKDFLRFLLNDTEHPTANYYEDIYEKNATSQQIVYEPVPRITKKPGDLIIQGSNNSSIVLGTESKGFTKDKRPEGKGKPSVNSEEPVDLNKGMVDIVSGRGRIYQELDKVTDKKPANSTTRPRVIKNIREEFETDKNVGLDIAGTDLEDSGHLYDPQEGDPDFLHDASRIFVSMKSNPDELLGMSYPDVAKMGDADNEAVAVEGVNDAATVIVKSDEIRIVARRKEENIPESGDPEINGSIKIVKEGVADSRDGDGRAVIMIQPDGTIMIDGPKIVIGSGAKAGDDGNGAGAQVSLGLAATEPMVLGEQLQGILSAIINVLDNHIHPTPSGPSTARIPGGSETAPGAFTNTTSDIADLQLMLSKLGKTL